MNIDPLPLAGRFALVTGASRGIGRSVAVRFAADGATVAINHPGDDAAAAAEALDLVRAAGRPGAEHRVVTADVSDEAAVDEMVAALVRDWGRLDILVNNAGIGRPLIPFEQMPWSDVERIFQVNLLGPVHCCRAAIAHFQSRPGGGCIINTTSVHEIVPKPGSVSYAMAKSGLGALTRSLALDHAASGIRVNAVGPGVILTDMNPALQSDTALLADVARHIPMRHVAGPDDITPVYSFLASDDASYVTGQTLYACGGITLTGGIHMNAASPSLGRRIRNRLVRAGRSALRRLTG